MNLRDNLTIIKSTLHGPMMLVPLVFLRKGEGVNPIPLQFDRNDLPQRVHADITNYNKAPMVKVDGEWSFSILVPIIFAKIQSYDDVKVEVDFGGGKLWGWFPKECA